MECRSIEIKLCSSKPINNLITHKGFYHLYNMIYDIYCTIIICVINVAIILIDRRHSGVLTVLLKDTRLKGFVELYTPRRTLRSSSDKLTLFIPKVRTLYGERSFRYHCAVEWNTLPHDIRSCESLDSLKAKLKTYLFSSAYHQSNCLLTSAVNNVLFTECFNEIYWNVFVSYKFTQI